MMDIHRMLENNIHETGFDVERYFQENFSMEHATTLSAKIEKKSRVASNSDILMYVAVAILSLAVFIWQMKQTLERRNKAAVVAQQNDIFERLI